MRKKRGADLARLKDWGRHLLVVLLLVSAALLLRHTGYYAGIRERLRLPDAESAAGTVAESGASRHGAVTVRPTAAAVCPSDGGERYGVAWEDGTATVLRRFSADLGEALGSAGKPSELSEEAFRQSLRRCGLFLEFYCPQPLELLSVWLGAEMSGAAASMQADRLCLSVADAAVQLCFMTPDGAFYSCDTAVLADGFRSRTAEFAPNGAVYAWESERLVGGDYTLLLKQAPSPVALRSSVELPGGTETDALLQTMGMNSFVASSYKEADGTVVYLDEDATLRISPSGAVIFRRTGITEAEETEDLALSVGSAWIAAEHSVGRRCGDANLLFAGAQVNAAQRTTTVLADYQVGGVPVRLADGHAAEIVMRGVTVVQARLQLRSFTAGEERMQLLPFLQAAAVAAADSGRPELVYALAGDAIECVWVIADE